MHQISLYIEMIVYVSSLILEQNVTQFVCPDSMMMGFIFVQSNNKGVSEIRSIVPAKRESHTSRSTRSSLSCQNSTIHINSPDISLIVRSGVGIQERQSFGTQSPECLDGIEQQTIGQIDPGRNGNELQGARHFQSDLGIDLAGGP